MSQDFLLPDIGEGIAEAEIAEWLVAAGDAVAANQPVVIVETDKMSVEIPTPFAGTVKELGAEVGETLPVGSALMSIEAGGAGQGDVPDDGRAEGASDAGPDDLPPVVTAAVAPAVAPPSGGRPKASPAVRRLARERSLDLTRITGSGPGGRIVRTDLETVADRPRVPVESATEDRRIPLRGARRTIAANVQRSWQQIPMALDFRQVDGSGLLSLRSSLKGGADGAPVGYDAIMGRILASALRRHPMLNAGIDEENEEIVQHGAINIGFAVAAERGVIVPVVHEADRLSIFEIAERLADLAARAKANSLDPADLRGATVTLNNTGALAPRGGLHMLPLINHPQAAILAFGRIHDCVFAIDGEPVVRPGMYLTCNADHRLVDGEGLVAFMDDVVNLAEDPRRLIGELR